MDESLFTAARRIVRFLNIDLNHGGLITEETEKALCTLEREIDKERSRQKASEAQADAGRD